MPGTVHIPVLLCGFICGWPYGLIVGLIAPILRFLLFGMPPIFPTGIAMSFELAAYGMVCGILYKKLPKTIPNIYFSLIGSMLAGRIVWGIAMGVIAGVGKAPGFPIPQSAFSGFRIRRKSYAPGQIHSGKEALPYR